MTRDVLVIVFGAGGRLGTRLLPLLAAEPVTVLGIARQGKHPRWPRRMHWPQVDVTNPEEWPHSLNALAHIAGVHERVVCVDLLLNRATVTAMRNSIAAVTTYILCLRDRLAEADRACSLVAASTTAVLAPWLYQTPYGLAKRRQLARYAASGITGIALLQPSPVDPHANAAARNELTFTYHEAAQHVATAVTAHAAAVHRRDFRIAVPGTPKRGVLRENRQAAHVLRAMKRLAPAHVDLILNRRDSPQAHREASHHRLALTPTLLRNHVDHHHAPQFLVNQLSRSLNTPAEILRRSERFEHGQHGLLN
ncbi:MAG: hypothetical protein ACRDTD_10390 [Pseudonocardiaceae bacterium]